MALALLVGVAAATWQSMSLSFETKRVVSDINDRYHEGRQVMSRLARELRMAFLLKPLPEQMREHDPTSTTRFLGGEDELYFATTAHLRLHAGDRESDRLAAVGPRVAELAAQNEVEVIGPQLLERPLGQPRPALPM